MLGQRQGICRSADGYKCSQPYGTRWSLFFPLFRAKPKEQRKQVTMLLARTRLSIAYCHSTCCEQALQSSCFRLRVTALGEKWACPPDGASPLHPVVSWRTERCTVAVVRWALILLFHCGIRPEQAIQVCRYSLKTWVTALLWAQARDIHHLWENACSSLWLADWLLLSVLPQP